LLLTIYREILSWLPHNSLALLTRREVILAFNLLVASADSCATGPQVDVVDASVPVSSALSAVVLETKIFFRVWVVDDFTLCEFAGGRGKRQRVGIGTCTASLVAAAAVVGGGRTGRIVICRIEDTESVYVPCAFHTANLPGYP